MPFFIPISPMPSRYMNLPTPVILTAYSWPGSEPCEPFFFHDPVTLFHSLSLSFLFRMSLIFSNTKLLRLCTIFFTPLLRHTRFLYRILCLTLLEMSQTLNSTPPPGLTLGSTQDLLLAARYGTTYQFTYDVPLTLPYLKRKLKCIFQHLHSVFITASFYSFLLVLVFVV